MQDVQITFRELLPDESLCEHARHELGRGARPDEAASCRAVVHRVTLPGRGLALVHATVWLTRAGRAHKADAVAATAYDAFRIALEAAHAAHAGHAREHALERPLAPVREPLPTRLRRTRDLPRSLRYRLHAC